MKNIMFCTFLLLIVSNIKPVVAADFSGCTITDTYTVCFSGYYVANGICNRCPSLDGVTGTTAGDNTGGITNCYIPANTDATDNTGTYRFSADCYYTN